MPKIIRSSGVNVERARPVARPLKSGPDMDALLASAEANRSQEMEKIKASADLIVEEIISKARNDADNMLVDARQQTINVLQDAVREGWEQGMHEALKQAQALQEAARQELDDAVEELTRQRTELLATLKPQVLELVFEIADKVLSIQMDRSQAWVEAMVKEAMAQLQGDETAVLKVADSARENVSALCARMLAAAGKRPDAVTVVADPRLGPGGCVIETERGSMDNSVETKAGRLKTILKESI